MAPPKKSPATGGILVEIRQGDRLVAALPLSADAIEVTLRDVRSGLPLGTLSARGPVLGRIDELPVPGLARAPLDDFTMPLPEKTDTTTHIPPELTGDLDAPEPETVEAPRPPRSTSIRRIPNLARAVTDEPTAPVISSLAVPKVPLPGDNESSMTVPRPSTTGLAPRLREETLSAHLMPEVPSEETLSVHLEDLAGPVPPAEVWARNASEWRSAGRLHPGQTATARRGWVRLEADGRLVVNPGPELAGTATLVDGSTIEIAKGGQRVRLPPGASVILRGPGHGLYVRTDPPLPSH
jgi:hypothetical protein